MRTSWSTRARTYRATRSRSRGTCRRDLDWLFDIVEPRNGDWNVFAHDRDVLDQLTARCDGGDCPLNALRLPGTPYYLLARYYEERDL